MTRRLFFALLLTLFFSTRAEAHIGSPDVFYTGPAGPYTIEATVRMPGVVPGRAQIFVRVLTNTPVTVAFAPIAASTSVKNTPPPEDARAVDGDTNFFTGELWLMITDGYSIDVRIHGAGANGSARIPVNSLATQQLPLPKWMAAALAALGLLLFVGGVAIVGAAAGEAVLPPGVLRAPDTRRRTLIAVSVTGAVLAFGLYGGWKWWNADEAEYSGRVVKGGWPAMTATVHSDKQQQILSLKLDDGKWDRPLALDHGKLMHVFLVREPEGDAFAHIHPFATDSEALFEGPLPPLPAGDYKVFCDLTLNKGGISTTATNTLHIPTISSVISTNADPDDSWTANATTAAKDKPGTDTIFHLPGGEQIIWKAHLALRAQQDAGLHFEARDESGHPLALEPYMGMLSHAAVMRSDAQVFCHLHPAGNFSLASLKFFDKKMANETGDAESKSRLGNADTLCGPAGSSSITLPYEFPSAGDYRVWVQVKTDGKILTALFDTTVQASSL